MSDTTTHTEDTSRQRNQGLHVSLDQSSAAYLINHPGSMLGGTSVTQLLEWAADKHPDLHVQLVILVAQFMGENRGASLDNTSILMLIVWSGRRDYKGN